MWCEVFTIILYLPCISPIIMCLSFASQKAPTGLFTFLFSHFFLTFYKWKHMDESNKITTGLDQSKVPVLCLYTKISFSLTWFKFLNFFPKRFQCIQQVFMLLVVYRSNQHLVLGLLGSWCLVGISIPIQVCFFYFSSSSWCTISILYSLFFNLSIPIYCTSGFLVFSVISIMAIMASQA